MSADDLDVIIALIPAGESGEWHSTLCATGKEDTSVNQLLLDGVVRMLARFTPPPYAVVMRYAMFGAENDTLVAQLDSPMLNSLYVSVQLWAKSQWGYTPHISKQDGHDLPAVGTIIRFDRIALWWGASRTTYRFGSGDPCAS